jgi:hypothetical protein
MSALSAEFTKFLELWKKLVLFSEKNGVTLIQGLFRLSETAPSCIQES